MKLNEQDEKDIMETFNYLFDEGYRFVENLESSSVVREIGDTHSKIVTPITHYDFSVDGLEVTMKEKERAINCISFFRAFKRKVEGR